MFSMVVDDPEEFRGRCFMKSRRKLSILELLKQYMHLVQATFTKVDRRTLVTVEIHQRGRIFFLFPFQIKTVFRRIDDRGNQRINALNAVVQKYAAFGD